MEDFLVDQEQWVVVKLGTKSIGTSDEDWMKLDKKSRSTIRLCLADSISLNVSEEDTLKKPWNKLGNLYQSKLMVNKLFLWNMLYLPRMNDDDPAIEHMNALNIVIN